MPEATHHPRAWVFVIASLGLACPGPGGETTATATVTSTATTTSTSGETASLTEVTGGGVACPEDSFEPNNVPTDATPIGDGEFGSVICPLDVDYYAFTVTRTTYLSVVLYLTRDDGS